MSGRGGNSIRCFAGSATNWCHHKVWWSRASFPHHRAPSLRAMLHRYSMSRTLLPLRKAPSVCSRTGLAVAEAFDGLGEGGGLVVVGEETEEDGRHRWSVLTYQSRVTP